MQFVLRLQAFPGDVVHIGGDECPQDRWKTCPKCQARMKKEGIADVQGLQPWITRHFVKFLAERGRRPVGWDEYLLGDVPKSAIGMSWRAGGGGAGHKFLTPRACAIAEAVWTGDKKPGFADFMRRMKTHRKRLLSQGVNCAPLK